MECKKSKVVNGPKPIDPAIVGIINLEKGDTRMFLITFWDVVNDVERAIKKIKNLNQPNDSRTRTWYEDDFFDLIVWFDDDEMEDIFGFQLCYDVQENEHSLTWKKDIGYVHNEIEGGEFGHGEIVGNELFVTCGNSPTMLDPVEEALVSGALAIERCVEERLSLWSERPGMLGTAKPIGSLHSFPSIAGLGFDDPTRHPFLDWRQ